MERRELLKSVGVATGASAAGVAGIFAYSRLDDSETTDNDTRSTPRLEVPPRYADEFETVVDAASAGADPDGESPINDFLTEYAGEDTLLTFRPGTYRLRPTVLSGFSKFGIVGVGDERPTIRPVNSNCRAGDAHLVFEAVEDFLLEDVDFDFRERGAGGAIHLFAEGDVGIRNVKLSGNCADQISMFRVDLRSENAEGIIENLVSKDEDGDSQLTGVYVGDHHAGSLTFRDCEISAFSDNGLYASSPGHPGGNDGVVNVVGGRFEDNDVSNVRLGSTGSVARDVTIDVESPNPRGGSANARGIRLREQGEHLIEGCDIRIANQPGESFGGIVFHPDAADAQIRDTRITIEADAVDGVNAFAPSEPDFAGPVLDDVTITGDAASGYAASIDGRDDTVFRNCRIEQRGADRGGIRLRNADGCRIVDSEIRTTGAPIELDDAAVSVRNTTITTPDGTRSIESLDARNEVLTP